MSTIKFGPLKFDPAELGSQGSAILGIRDSGKTYTATWFAERLFDSGIPFIAFDPIGIWRFLRVPGAGKGYPIVVAGGQEGDLPLTVASAPEIVRAAMNNGVSLVIDLFDINLSKADWKRIVTSCVRVLLHENAKHGLRHVFIEEAAEFAPQRVGPDQGLVYAEMEKLARMGGNSRLGYTLINQRAEEVNKALLELCDNLFLHRQKGKNSLNSLTKWLDVGNVKDHKDIIGTLSTLPTGDCWAWPAGTERPVLVHVPSKNSLHPDRRVMRGDVIIKSKAAVDVGAFVETMKGSLGKFEDEAKANDPKALKAEIAKLTAEKAALGRQMAQAIAGKVVDDPEKIEKAEQRGYSRGFAAAAGQASTSFEALKQLASTTVRTFAESFQTNIRGEKIEFENAPSGSPATDKPAPAPTRAPLSRTEARTPSPAASGDGPIGGVQQKILNSVAEMETLCRKAPPRTLVAMVAGYKNVKSTGFAKALSGLSTDGLVTYPDSGTIALTAEGMAVARPRAAALTTEEVHSKAIDILGETAGKILGHVLAVYPGVLEREVLAERSGYQNVKSTGFAKALSRLSSLGFVSYPSTGTAKAGEILFP